MKGRTVSRALAKPPRFLWKALRRTPRGLLLLLALLALPLAALAGAGLGSTGPVEERYVSLQEKRLWRDGAEVWAAEEYRDWRTRARRAADELLAVEGRLFFLRDYAPVTAELRALLDRGDEIARLVRTRRAGKRGDVAARISEHRDKVARLNALSTLVSVGRSYREAQARTHLTKADLLVCEAEGLVGRGELLRAEGCLDAAAGHLDESKRYVLESLRRFGDEALIRTWRSRVAETIRESKVRGTYAIVVSKVDRKLVLYKAGRPVRTYEVGIGSGSIEAKLRAGDRATPEGRYRVVKKIPRSRFHKALLLDYPNAEDLRRFQAAKRSGAIPGRAGIGGLIEIHGGGRDGMTLGCVALEDRHMDELFALVTPGTAVTIVGATDYENAVALALRGL